MEKVKAYKALFDALAAIPESEGWAGAIFDKMGAAFDPNTPDGCARRNAVRMICDAYHDGADVLELSIPASRAGAYVEMLKYFGIGRFRCPAGAELLAAFCELGVSFNHAECVFVIGE